VPSPKKKKEKKDKSFLILFSIEISPKLLVGRREGKKGHNKDRIVR
jgi:hypothetical protein